MLIAVCDDEKAVRETIRDLIKAQKEDAHILISFLVLAVSTYISMRIYEKTDL